jgi:hypothetical protein
MMHIIVLSVKGHLPYGGMSPLNVLEKNVIGEIKNDTSSF